MRIETRNNGIRDYQVVIADAGKTLKRIADNHMVGDEYALGKTWYYFDEDGEVYRLPEPIEELPEHFTEVDAPQAIGPEEQEPNTEE